MEVSLCPKTPVETWRLHPEAPCFVPRAAVCIAPPSRQVQATFSRRSLDGSLIQIFHPPVFDRGLAPHPGPEFRDFILRTIAECADIGVDENCAPANHRQCRNSPSIQDFPGKVLQEIRQDVADGSKFGPFSALHSRTSCVRRRQ